MRLAIFLFGLLAFSAIAGEPQLSPNAPPDQPVAVAPAQIDSFEALIAPYIAQAKSTYPAAKIKYLAGLPRGQHFFVTTRLRDSAGAFEQVFIAVSAIRDGVISGRIASDINTVRGYKNGDAYSFPESDLVDWLIALPDGSEEGNVVGKFLDGYHGSGA